MRTMDIDAATPLLISSVVVAASEPWERSRLEFTAATEYAQGVRLRFCDPHDVRTFAAAVRRFAADCRDLERLNLAPPSHLYPPTPLRPPTRGYPRPLSFMP